MKRIYRIGKIGTKKVTVEEAEDERSACRKAGWPLEKCEIVDITNEVIVLLKSGDLQVLKGAPLFS